MATLIEPAVVAITEPGVYDLAAETYHADPVPGGSLSSTGARKLLPPSCPALYRYWADHPEPTKHAWDIGHAAHKLVLGVGPELVCIEGTGVDPEAWRTNDDKAAVAAARARGAVPLKPADYAMVQAMAAAIRVHPIASALFIPRGTADLRPDNGTGRAEQTLVWRDTQTGVMCRARLDYLPYFTLHSQDSRPASVPAYPGRLILPEYKTAACLEDDAVERAIAAHGYHVQLLWYLTGLRALGLAGDDAVGLLVMQEKVPPFLVRVVQPDPPTMRIASGLCRDALQIYADCLASGRWPGYSDDVDLFGLPPWVERQYESAGAW